MKRGIYLHIARLESAILRYTEGLPDLGVVHVGLDPL